jgi:hypothetical protein
MQSMLIGVGTADKVDTVNINNLTLYLLTQYKSIYYSIFRTKQLKISTRRS